MRKPLDGKVGSTSCNKAFIGLLIAISFILLASLILTPSLYWVIEKIFGENLFPFHRVFHRVLLISALISAAWLYHFWNIQGSTQIGLVDRYWHKHLFYGIFMGLCTMGFLTLIELFFGWRKLDFDSNAAWSTWLGSTLGIILAAFIVSLIEETLFRGFFFHALKSVMEHHQRHLISWTILMAAIFASAHFLRAPSIEETIHWTSGFKTWIQIVTTIRPFTEWVPSWLALFLVGLFLTVIVHKTGSLWESIGWHAGWIIILKSSVRWTEELQNSTPSSLFWLKPGTELYNGGCGLILLFFLLIWAVGIRKQKVIQK